MSYLVFTEDKDYSKGRKTKRWVVTSVRGSQLGSVMWYGAWRQFCFFPAKSTIFNTDCLTEIADFCRARTQDWRDARRVANL